MHGKAAVLVGKNRLETWDVEVSAPEPGGAVVRTILGGVCGSDVHIVTGDAGEMPFPIILGHEGVDLGCHRCYSCTILEETPCENSRYFEDAAKPNWGSYSDYAWLPNNMPFYRLPDGAQPEAIAALGCALPTVLRGFDRCGPVRFGDSVVVQGAGPVGLSGVLVAAQAGAREIIVIDGAPARLEAAIKLGATSTVSLGLPAEERKRMIYDLTGKQGPDIVIEAAGALPAFPEGVDISGIHSRYIILGLWGAIGTQPISPRDLTLKNLTISGASFPSPKNYYQAMQFAARVQDRVPLADLVSHRFGIGQAAEALEVTRTGVATKAVIDPTIN